MVCGYIGNYFVVWFAICVCLVRCVVCEFYYCYASLGLDCCFAYCDLSLCFVFCCFVDFGSGSDLITFALV